MLDLADLIARLDAGEANNDEVLRVIASYDSWFVPLCAFGDPSKLDLQGPAKLGDWMNKLSLDWVTITSWPIVLPASELWLFSDKSSIDVAAKKFQMGPVGGPNTAERAFALVLDQIETIRINPGSRSYLTIPSSLFADLRTWLDRVALESLISGLPDTATELVARFASFEGAMVPVIGAQALGEATENGRLEYVCTTPEDCCQLLDELPTEIIPKLRWGRASGRAIIEDAPRSGFAGLCLNPADPGRRAVIFGEALDAFLRDSSQKI